MKRKIIIGLGLILLLIQAFRPTRNNAKEISPNDIRKQYAMPADIEAIFQRSCFDCHSNRTNYPWYVNIQPVGWWLQHHINEGKSKLNFSEFNTYSRKKADHKLEEVEESLEEGWMPLESYTWIHKSSKLTDEERTKVLEWVKTVRAKINRPAL